MMTFLLSLVTSNKNALLGLGIALALTAGFAGLQTYRLAAETRDHAETRAAHAEQLATLERAAREAEALARSEEQRRAAALQGVIHETEQQLAQARADADAAVGAGDRLRQRISQLASACSRGASNPGTAGAGTATDATTDLLAVVQRRLDEATERIARFADQSRAAGLACQNSYRALTP